LDAEELRDYFDLNKKKKSSNENKQQEEYQTGSSVIMSVSGRCYPVDIFYVQGNSFKSNIFIIKNNKTNFILDPVPDYMKASVDCAIKISNQEPSGDVLIFLTGSEEVDNAVRLLKDYAHNCADSSRKGIYF